MNVLIIDDDPNLRKTLSIALKGMGHESDGAGDGATALERLQQKGFDVAILDLKLEQEDGLQLLPELLKIEPSLIVIVLTAFGSFETAVKAVKQGAHDFVAKPITPDQVRAVFGRLEKLQRLETRVVELETEISSERPARLFTTKSPVMKQVFRLAQKVASTPSTVLITGESGTGKTVLARCIHEQGPRGNYPFVTVSCPGLGHDLLESELFGHVKGAFTGAVKDKTGKVAMAEGGTLFLDEIGELPLDLQPKLLRLIQEREYERVGDSKTRRANVRLIAATNSDLEKMLREQLIREDFYYRLNVVPIEMPPLRSRKEDIPELSEGFLHFFSRRLGKQVTGFKDDALKALQVYSWPGNLRELENTIERTLILTNNEEVSVADLPESLRERPSPTGNPHIGDHVSLRDLERQHIRQVLDRSSSLEEAAKTLGIDSATLYRKRKRMGI